MGAIVNVKLPQGMNPEGVREKIKKALSEATGQSVSVVVNAISQVPQISTPNTIPSTGLTAQQ
jgi:hypothetical protein